MVSIRRILSSVASFISSHFNPAPGTPPTNKSRNNETNPVSVVVYQSEKLTGKCGRAPEEVVFRAIADAFDAAGVSYDMKRDQDLVSLPSNNPDDAAINGFVEAVPDKSVDCRLCLIDAVGGGTTDGYGGTHAIMGASNIEKRFDPSLATVPLSLRAKNVRGALHEVGHALGGRHTTPILADPPKMRYSEPMVRQIKNYIQTGENAPEGGFEE